LDYPDLTSRQRQALALFALAAVTILFILGLFQPLQFEYRITQIILCLACAVYLSVFFFVFYPSEYRLERVPYLNLPVQVSGPVAICIVVFSLLLFVMPGERTGRFIKFNPNLPLYFSERTTVVPKDGTQRFTCYVVGNPGTMELYGVFIEFPPGISKCPATIKHPFYEPLDFTFTREMLQADLTFSKAEESR
jgi:hypothetical protein